jgi:hypothetical protein
MWKTAIDRGGDAWTAAKLPWEQGETEQATR